MKPEFDISCGTKSDVCYTCNTNEKGSDLRNVKVHSIVICLCKKCREKLKEIL